MEEFVLVGVVMLLGLGAYWTMVLFPKQRDFQKRQRFARALSVGDEVITYGGIIGKVIDIRADEGIAYVEISEGVIIRIVTAAMMQPYDPEEIARNARIGIEKETLQQR